MCTDSVEIPALRALFSERTRWPHHPNPVWEIPIFETSENIFIFFSFFDFERCKKVVTSGTHEKMFDKGDDDVRGYWKGWVRSGEYERKIGLFKVFFRYFPCWDIKFYTCFQFFLALFSLMSESKVDQLIARKCQQKQKFRHSRTSGENKIYFVSTVCLSWVKSIQ